MKPLKGLLKVNKIEMVANLFVPGIRLRKTLKGESNSISKRRTPRRNHSSYIKNSPDQPARYLQCGTATVSNFPILFMIAVMLFIGAMASGNCIAAGNSQEIRIGSELEFLEKLNQGLVIVKTNGKYDRIYHKWLTADDPWQRIKRYFLPMIIMVITTALVAGAWLVTLHRLVKKRNSEIAERKQMEEGLLWTHNEMEKCVMEGTCELKFVNEELRKDIVEHKQTELHLKAALSEIRLLNTDFHGH